MTDILKSSIVEPQCKFFVVRKKRLCRMTVKPGREYCGEHEPQPRTEGGQDDTRIPCPYDPKHTCYASKLEKHLSICNARLGEVPPYIVQNTNAPSNVVCKRIPLQLLQKEIIASVIDKVNMLYEKYIQDQITMLPDRPIHSTVLEEYSQADRAETSLRHLRQTSRLLHVLLDEGLVEDQTCYVELGAGKGQLSFYICKAYCGDTGSAVLLVDRASLRHKRDNKLGSDVTTRVRADLAHLALGKVPLVEAKRRVVGAAKHLCGVATDYALRCITGDGVLRKTSGVVLATCCHHRCEQAGYVANNQLRDLGITAEDLNVMLGIVSWATCGDGRSREKRRAANNDVTQATQHSSEERNDVSVSKDQNSESMVLSGDEVSDSKVQNSDNTLLNGDAVNENRTRCKELMNDNSKDNLEKKRHEITRFPASKDEDSKHLVLPQEYREMVGRRAKALLDWGRVLYLRECGFDARLCHYVSTKVSLENVCIIAKKTVS